ncbi:hypothetical protein [Synechococcus phage S-MS29]|nr:hypothetical protein [Synechococcus phage S-MS29]
MLSFKELSEKKTKVTINPKLDDLKEKAKLSDHGEDCDCMKCEKKRRGEEVDDGPDVANESAVPGKPAERLKTDRNMFSIPKDEREAAAERLKAKAAAKRKAKGMKEGYYDPMEDDTFDHDEAERTRGQSGKNKSITVKKKTKKSTKKEEVAYVSQEEVSEESGQSIEKEETSSLLKFEDFVSALNDINEGRAEDAKKSLDAVKKRQGVLDAHEKKTGKKLDITKTPEHKAHKQNFPGAKRQAKKVKGAKETPAEKHSREVQTYTDRLKKYGKTKKQAAYDKAMSKQTSRFD